jgi:hypothetical protein
VSEVVDDIVRRLAAQADGDAGIAGKVMKFDGGADGVVVIDASAGPVRVTAADRPADCTVKMAASALRSIVAGEASCGATYMRFVRGVEGDQALAVLVQPFLRRAAAASAAARGAR